MANVIKAGQLGGLGVIVVDTAADNIVAAGNPVKISKIRWEGATTVADSATVMEAGGSTPFWEGTVVGTPAGVVTDESDFYSDRPLILNGLKVGALTHGKLYIYVGT